MIEPQPPIIRAETIQHSGALTMQVKEFSGAVRGDMFLTPRTWVRDAIEAGPMAIVALCWSIGFGLVAGGTTAALAGLILRDLIRAGAGG